MTEDIHCRLPERITVIYKCKIILQIKTYPGAFKTKTSVCKNRQDHRRSGRTEWASTKQRLLI